MSMCPVVICGGLSRTFLGTLLCLTIAVGALGSSLFRATRIKAPPVRPSRLVADTYMDVLCRPPSSVEILRWDGSPVEKAALAQVLDATEEAGRLRKVRQAFFDLLRREPTSDDCSELRDLIDRRLDIDAVRGEIANLAEARRVAAVRQLFIEVFNRDPLAWDDPSLRRWTDSPFGLREIRSRLVSQRPIVGVHYFAWYQPDAGGWRNHETRVPADSPKPALGWYNSADPVVMATQIRQMEETGFDFVAVHVIPALPQTWSNAHAFVDRLSGHRLHVALVLDSLYDESPAVKARWVEKTRQEFGSNSHYLRLHGQPLVMLFSTRIDFDVPGVLLRNVYWSYRYDPGKNPFNGNLRLEPRDWPFWAPTPQPVANGLVPVIPGYTDAGLGRAQSMVHERNNGQMYREQWRRALTVHPEVILVYSWNEYFERTAIEPTDAWGDQYLRLTACFIGHAHRGESGDC
jgi:hypothetical protein